MKILGMVNKSNRGIAKANKELEKNGNPKAQFDVNKLTEFRVTVMPHGESGQIKWPDKQKSGTMIGESGTMNGKSGTMILGKFHREYMGERVDATVSATVNDSIVDIAQNNLGIRCPRLLELLTTINPSRKYRRYSADARIFGSAGEKIDGYS